MNIEKMEKKYIGDTLLCLMLLLLSVILFIFRVFSENDSFNTVTLFCNGEEIRTFSLSENEDYFGVEGTVISVTDGKAYIKSTDCPDKTCQKMSPVTNSGGSIVCVPKKIVLKPEHSNPDYDTIVG